MRLCLFDLKDVNEIFNTFGDWDLSRSAWKIMFYPRSAALKIPKFEL